MFKLFKKKDKLPPYDALPVYEDYKIEKNTMLYFTQRHCLENFFLILQASGSETEETNRMYVEAIDGLIDNKNAFTKEQWLAYLLNFKIIL